MATGSSPTELVTVTGVESMVDVLTLCGAVTVVAMTVTEVIVLMTVVVATAMAGG